MSIKRTRLHTARTLLGAALVGALLAVATPAFAASKTITHSQLPNVSYQLADSISNTSYAQNSVLFRQTANNGAGYLYMALRQGSAAAFARGTSYSGGSWITIKQDTGQYWIGVGTFYINTEVHGACGGVGCNPDGTMTYSAEISYNNKYIP